jgi:anaerobic selenocysteine-containing dehydrogenase
LLVGGVVAARTARIGQFPSSRVWVWTVELRQDPSIAFTWRLRAAIAMGPSSSLPHLGESVCPYCGVGCRLRLEGSPGQGLRVRGVAEATANLGGLCAKGAQLGSTIDTPDRLTQPQIRRHRHDNFHPVGWDLALSRVARRFQDILRAHGPDLVGFYGSGQLDSETAYLAAKLFKGFLGTNNTDSNSRLCMAAAVAGYRTSLGSDGPPCCYDDIEMADIVLIIDRNMAEAHPVTFDRIRW